MSDFETHPVGTTQKIAEQQARIWELEDQAREQAMEYLALEWQAQEALDECARLQKLLDESA